jgi:hypothetical protein
MTTPSEQWIVSALREAADRMPLPPESRWIRERRSTPSVSMILLVGVAAILIIAAGMTIGALRVEPRLVPAAGGPSAFAFEAREDVQWRTARAALRSDLVLLRPVWIPAEFRGSAECPSPLVIVTGAGYEARYQGRVLPNGECAVLVYGADPSRDHQSDPSGPCGPLDPCGPVVEIATFNERGTTVHVSIPRTDVAPPRLQFAVWWNESGAHHDMLANGIELDDLLRVIRSLEPVQ